jgi:hypothetical protein
MLAIDTSSARSGVALVDGDRVLGEVVKPSGRGFDVAAEVALLVPRPRELDAVLVALGPGSFTGLRQGIAFGVAVVDAGRGRVYFQAPDGRRGIAEMGKVPRDWPAVGWLRLDGLQLLPESNLRTFGEAAIVAREVARAVGYGTVTPEYMSHFGSLQGES